MLKLLFVLLISLPLAAQEAAAPTLTDLQRATLQVKYLQYELAKLRLDTAQSELLALITSLQREGYTFDITTMTYTPVKVEK